MFLLDAAVVEVLKSGWLTTGAKVREFEKRFCRFVGSRHTVAVNSATAALHLALKAVGVRERDEVIVPTMTFAATAESCSISGQNRFWSIVSATR
jgi:dTDP-4-amino-4,6-dideoxygalactose transaminase